MPGLPVTAGDGVSSALTLHQLYLLHRQASARCLLLRNGQEYPGAAAVGDEVGRRSGHVLKPRNLILG